MNRVLLACACALLGSLAASSCSSGTGGELIEIDVEAVAEGHEGAPPGSFETATGWQVELEEATLALRSVLAYAPDPRAALDFERLLVGNAFAHGGYDPFNGRIVRAEYAKDVDLDLLDDEPVPLAVVEAEAGPMESVSVLFGEQASGQAGQAFVRGVASKDGQRIEFEGTLEIEDEPLLRRVDGIDVKGTIAAGGALRLVVRPHLLFDEAHFERLDVDADGHAEITPDTQVHTTWVFGARSTRTYGTQWRKP